MNIASLSRHMTHKGLLGKVLAGLLLVAPWGCGVKTNPVPPQQVVPQAITDLRYNLSEKGVVLQWSYPERTVGGGKLGEVLSFELYRAVVSEDGYCPTCPVPYGEPLHVSGGLLPEQGRREASYESSLLRPGHRYFFKVRSRTGWWSASQDSNIVSFVWQIPPQAPEGLAAEPRDGGVALRWQPVTALIDGSPAPAGLAYQVSRSRGGAGFEPLGNPVSQPEYVDTGLENGKKYFYRVQAVLVQGDTTVSGGMTSDLGVAPVDKTPPATPKGLTTVRVAEGVRIFWQAPTDKDLGGYRIYRRAEGESKATLVGEVNIPYTLFVDGKPPARGDEWAYVVTAVDQSQPANESAPSPEVKVQR